MAYGDAIYIGSDKAPSFAFDDTQLESVICNNSVDLVGNELSMDVLEVSVFYDDADEHLRNVVYATPVYYYSAGEFVGKYYTKSVTRTGKQKYFIRATSIVGLIEDERFYGGMYNGEYLSNVMDKILFCDGLSPEYEVYYVENTLGNMTFGVALDVRIDSPALALKYGIETTFVVEEPYWSGDSELEREFVPVGAGFVYGQSYRTTYGVIVRQRRESSSSPTYWEFYFCYSNVTVGISGASVAVVSDGEAKFGNGTEFSIRVNPTGGFAKVSIDVNYVKYDDASIVGGKHVEALIAIPATSSASINIDRPFGGSSEYYSKLLWKSYLLYDNNGKLVIDAGFFYDPARNKKYIVNTVTGYFDDDGVTSWNPAGTLLGVTSDFKKYRMILEIGEVQYFNDTGNIMVYGWIPVCKRREALHQLLFAYNVNMIKGESGQIIILGLSNGLSGEIPDDRLYNEGSEEKVSPAKKVTLAENSYSTVGLESRVVFDNSDSIVGEDAYVAYFNGAPIYGVPVGSGVVISSYNCNAAIVTGRGIITATPYLVSERVLRYDGDESAEGQEINVSGVGLITSLNSDSVMNRLKAYYCVGLINVKNGILYGGEKCGNVYGFNSPFEEELNAFLVKYTLQKSEVAKANCEFISGYVPPKSSGYSSFIILTYGEEWSIPESVKEGDHTVRLNIIGRGKNGTNGGWGEGGKSATLPNGPGGDGGAGGAGGKGGSGGDIISVTVDVENADTILVREDYRNNTEVLVRQGYSTLETYSSASGVPSETGFVNLFTGVSYALPGLDGIDGGAGGKGGYTSAGDFSDNDKGTQGEDVGVYVGGLGSLADLYGEMDRNNVWVTWKAACGGGGGGAAYGSNGESAPYPSYSSKTGLGGKGADAGAAIVTNTGYGCGGSGGNGGGGGGGAGLYYYRANGSTTTDTLTPGGGGRGSAGSPGIEGCVIVYY